MNSLFGNKKVIALLVLPGLCIMLFAIAIPLLISAALSLVKWSGFGRMRFIGVDNYLRLFTDMTFWKSLYNALMLIVVTVLFQNVLAFFVASILTKIAEKTSRVLRTIYFIPAILSLVVVTKLWVHIFHPTYGLLNKLLSFLGFADAGRAWLGDPKTALWAVIWIMIWQGFGWALLFFYGGLMTVPKELEEAAIVDGANRRQLYMNVVLPYMMPVLQSIVIIDVISSLKQMEMIYLSTAGGPGDTTQFIALYLYQRAFKYTEYGYGNAISVLIVVIAVFFTLGIQRMFKKSVEQI